MYGLANALWESETSTEVAEACMHARVLLEDVTITPAGQAGLVDAEGVRYFILDLCFETGRWEDAIWLLARYPDEWTGEWAWGSALVQLRARGFRSKSARTAVVAAIGMNPHVFPLLLGLNTH